MISKQDIEKVINDLKLELKLNDIEVPEEVSELFNLSRDELKNRNLEELAIDAVRLSQYALYLNREINRYKAVKQWCHSNIDSIYGREAQNINGYGMVEKKLILCRNDSDAQYNYNIQAYCDVKLEYLDGLVQRVDNLSNYLRQLTYVRGNYGG